MRLISRALRIRAGEGRAVGLLVSLMFVALASLAVGQSGIEALFFDRVGTGRLPLMYLLQGGTTFVAMVGLTGLLGRLGPRRTYLLTPLALGSLLLAERAILAVGAGWIYGVLWLTVPLAMLVQGIVLWGVAGAVVDARQAKRLFPVFGAGGILGSVVGGLATRPLAELLGTPNLTLVWVVGLAMAFVLCRAVLGPATRARRRSARRGPSALREMARGLGAVRRSPLLVWMTAAAVLFSVLYFSLYLPYARAATERFPDAEQLAGFFGAFWAGLTAVAFLVSMLVANRLFVWLGVAATAVVLPLLYMGAFGILLVSSGFVALVASRFVIGVWLQGVAAPGWETLVNVVPEGRRDQIRAFMNGGPTQAGTAIAGVMALIGQEALSARQFALIGLIAAALTAAAAIGIRRAYAGALLDALRAGRPQVFGTLALGAEVVRDAQAVRALAQTASSDDVRLRRLAFALLAEGASPEVARGLDDPDPIVRLGAVRGVDVSGAEVLERLRTLAWDADPAVAAAAAARLLQGDEDPRVAERLRGLVTDPDEGVRAASIDQLDLAPGAVAVELVERSVTDASAAVRASALERLAAAAPDRALESALAALHDPEPRVRLAAGRALGASGAEALDHVLAALGDPRTTDAGVEAARRAGADGRSDRVRAFVVSAAASATRDRDLAVRVPVDGAPTRLLRDAILDRGRRTARSALWAMTMLAPRRTAMEAAIESLDGDRRQLANALETLEASGDRAVVRPLLTLWELGGRAADRAEPGDDWLAAALEHEDDLIRRCAELVRAAGGGGEMSRPTTTLSTMERMLFLRKVPLFADLAPAELEGVAAIAEERGYADGETIAAEGEIGDELHIVIDGVIRVVRGDDRSPHEVARRSAGDVVGEMSIVTRRPRIASLIAEGGVRTVRIGRREFESILRERPGVALGVVRVLAERLAEDAGRA